MTRIDSRICPPPYRFDAFRGTSTSSAYDSAGATTASATRALPVRSGRSGSRPMLMENASVTAQQLRTVQLSTRTHLFIHLTSRDCHLHSHLSPPSNRLLYFSPYLHEGTLIESSHRFSLPLRNLGFRVVIDWNFSVKYLSLLSLSLSGAFPCTSDRFKPIGRAPRSQKIFPSSLSHQCGSCCSLKVGMIVKEEVVGKECGELCESEEEKMSSQQRGETFEGNACSLRLGFPLQQRKLVVVGYALTSKKIKSFMQPKLEGLAR